MRGRKTQPRELKERRGNPGKRPLPEPVPIGQALDTVVTEEGEIVGPLDLMPVPLDLPDDGRLMWEAVVPELAAVGMINHVDGFSLKAMCIQWSHAEMAQRALLVTGLVAEGSMGQIVEHPLVATVRSAHSLFLRFCEQYGLTASARARIGLNVLEGQKLSSELDEKLGPPPLPPAQR